MQIKDLIAKLEALYNTYDDEYKAVMGEPEIMIDVFEKSHNDWREYAGWSPTIIIDKSYDGVYDILSAFYEDHPKREEAAQSASSTSACP
jgi:hypothetical protein